MIDRNFKRRTTMRKLTAGQKHAAKCRKELEDRFGLEADRWGHYKFNTIAGSYRVKFQKTTMRLEVKTGSAWVLAIPSQSYKNGIGFLETRLMRIA